MTSRGPTIEDHIFILDEVLSERQIFNHMNNKSTLEVKRNRVEGIIDDYRRP